MDDLDRLKLVDRLTTTLLSSANPDSLASSNVKFLVNQFQSPANVERFLARSKLFARARLCSRTSNDISQLCAKLHTLYGTSVDCLGRRCSNATYPYARAVTYDLRGFTDNNLWGPFLDESSEEMGGLRVDWDKVEAIMIVLGYNLRHFHEHHDMDVVWESPFNGLNGETQKQIERWKENGGVELIKQPDLNVDDLDPYKITGTYRRVSDRLLVFVSRAHSSHRSCASLITMTSIISTPARLHPLRLAVQSIVRKPSGSSH